MKRTYVELPAPPFSAGDRVRISDMGAYWLAAPCGTRGTVTRRGLQTITVLIDGEQQPRAWAPDMWVREAQT